jgi:hypothetical protein
MTDDVEQALFDSSDREEARSLLPKGNELATGAPLARVLTAVIWLSEGNLEKLGHFSAVARLDWRDVVHWAEDPRDQGEPRSWEELRIHLGLVGNDGTEVLGPAEVF